MGEIAAYRFFNILLQNKTIFRMSPTYIKQKKCLKILHDFTDSVIVARREELVSEMNRVNGTNNRKHVLLDNLLQSTIDGEPLSNVEIREEVDTFVFAGHGTTTSGIAFCLYNLAKYPEVQDKLLEEIKSVFSDDLSKIATQNDLNKLNYMDLVIKETLRMYPPIPFYGRETQEDITISKS